MSSNETTPYTVPYTGAAGNRVAHRLVPASSMEPTATAHPPAPQNTQDAACQKPAVADEPKGPNTGFAMSASTAMAGGSTNATSDANSAARRSSVIHTTHDNPYDVIPDRFASASSGSGGIAIIHPGVHQSADVYSSPMAGNGHNSSNQGSSSFGLDGQQGYPGHNVNLVTGPSPQAVQSYQLSVAQSHSLWLAQNHGANIQNLTSGSGLFDLPGIGPYNCVHMNMWTRNNNHNHNNIAGSLFDDGLEERVEELEARNEILQAQLDNLTSLVASLNNNILSNNPGMIATLPGNIQEMLENVYEDWKYNEWRQAARDSNSQPQVTHRYLWESALDHQMAGLGIHFKDHATEN